jgi:hypothetical protein
VRDAQKLDFAIADPHTLARLDGDEAIAGIDAVFLELRAEQGQREGRAVNGPIDQGPNVGHPADVILVTVRQQKRRRAWLALLQIREVRYQKIDAGQLGSREHHTGIDNDSRLVRRDDHRVHPEFTEPAKRDNLQSWSHKSLPLRCRTFAC